MKILRTLPVALALVGLTAAGCVLISGQFLVTYDLPSVTVPGPLAVVPIQVDLNTVGDYRDHKQNLKGLADEALVGVIKNDKPSALTVQVWLTREATTYTNADSVRARGILVWGPLTLAANETHRVDWDGSAALITKQGRPVIESEIKGDGVFTIYVLGTGNDYGFTVTEGKLLAIIDGGV